VNSAERVPKVVSITPLRADQDSRALRIASSFVRAGWESMLLEGAPSASSFEPSVTVHTLGGAATGRSRAGKVLGDLLLRPALRIPRADAYYLHGYYQYPGVRTRSLLHRTPIIYDAHDFYPALEVRRTANRVQRSLESVVEDACIRRAKAFVTVSDGVADLYEHHSGRRPVVLPNFHDARLDAPVTSNIREAIGAGPKETVVVIIGQRKSELPFRAILRAGSLLSPSVRLVFLGHGYSEAERSDAASQTGARATILDAVPPSHVVPFVRGADLALVAYRGTTNESVRQCLPNGLFQAVAAELGVLYAGDLPMVRSFLGEAGLPMDADDASSIAATIEQAANDDMRRRLQRASRDLATSASWERVEQDALRLVEDVLRSRRGAVRASSGSR
jgi:glycosyltransferase involved in cell wall biosynthesis